MQTNDNVCDAGRLDDLEVQASRDDVALAILLVRILDSDVEIGDVAAFGREGRGGREARQETARAVAGLLRHAIATPEGAADAAPGLGGGKEGVRSSRCMRHASVRYCDCVDDCDRDNDSNCHWELAVLARSRPARTREAIIG